MSLGALLAALLASAATAPAPAPERGVAVVLERVSGTVSVRTEAAGEYRRLRSAERLPVLTTVDAQEGRVRLTVARDDEGGTWSAVFAEGKFTVEQPEKGEPVTTLTLTGPTFRATCGDATAARRGKPRRVRRLWGNGHGRFRTSGHYSAATVRGTKWLTEDRCDGTVTRVVRGTVEVEDFTDDPVPAPPAESGPDTPTAPRPGAPAPAPVNGAPGTYIVPTGGSYVARPGS